MSKRVTRGKTVPKPKTFAFKVRIRIYAGDRMLGPGKMELLAHIDATGTLAAAAKTMRMSYMRAWTLVQNLNSDPDRPMVEMYRGGLGGGGAKVSRFGKRILALYQSMERESTKAATPYRQKLAKLLE
jgi:molybdate transport system regulatory protein